jgi:tRNA (guanosine-2'-O-)-methyltransferase
MTPERYRKLRATLNRRQPDLSLLTEQIHKPRNIAALVRTGDAVGMHTLNMVWPWDEHRAYRGTAMGSDRWVNIKRHDDLMSGIDALHNDGYTIYAAHLSHTAKDYRLVDYTKPCAILLGNEKRGVSDDAAERVNEHIMIPMLGMVQSFNVSVAAAIILAEAQRQRMVSGMYDAPRLSKDEYWQTFFRWAHPQVTNFCHEKGLTYPEINHENGEIVDPSGWYAKVRAAQHA